MISATLFLLLGFLLLFFGADWLVRGSSSIAKTTGIRPVIIALTIVAFGTSAPEFVVTVNASLQNTSAIAVGNIVGSIIANIGLVLGFAALVKPIKIEFRLLKKEIPIMIAAEILFILAALNQVIGRIEGFGLFLCFILFNWYCIKEAKRNIESAKSEILDEYKKFIQKRQRPLSLNITFAIAGIIALIFGSHFAVKGAISIAKLLDISPFIIGASVIAFGTSLPEFATSVFAAAKGESDISVGNILGSNIFNIFMCIGFAAIVSPLTVAHSTITMDLPIMIGLSAILSIFMWTRLKIGRLEGLLLILCYGGYLFFLFNK